MSGFDATHPRFLRPIDVARLRRNQNRIHVQRVLGIIRNVVLFGVVALIALAIYRHTQSDARFAVRNIEVTGAVHTSQAELNAATARYIGMNLFKIDIAGVQHELRALPWISHIEIEKKLPGTMRMVVTERKPVALAMLGNELRYVDENGTAFAGLNPAAGDPDLPLILSSCATRIVSGACPDMVRSVALIRTLAARDPEVYSRISEVRPIAPAGFELYDRDLGAVVLTNGEDVSAKWRSLYSIVKAERLRRGQIAYADLRFADRVVIKPRLEHISSNLDTRPSTLN